MAPPESGSTEATTPPPLSSRAQGLVERYMDARTGVPTPEEARAIDAVARHAPALMALCISSPELMRSVLERPLAQGLTLAELRHAFREAEAHAGNLEALLPGLRRLRHLHMVRIALREVFGLADVDQTSQEIAWLAAAAIDSALNASRAVQAERWGEALTNEGAPVRLAVFGMGKLGGYELNFGSDVDLCFFYETDQGATTDGEHTVHEFMSRVITQACQALSEVTQDGFCFRVDLRLRPEGSQGPIANSLVSAERYYTSWGRTWERGVLLRSSPIAGDLEFGATLKSALLPFIFRREVDPTIASQMYGNLIRARRETSVDEERELKLSRGGIREAEFFVQINQLIWGGQYRELQVAGTVDAIRRLNGVGLLAGAEAEALEADWAFLRRVEHRIHMWTGYQTHMLPDDPDALSEFAHSLGFPSSGELHEALNDTRDRVAALMADLIDEAAPPSHGDAIGALCHAISQEPAPRGLQSQLDCLGIYDVDAAMAHLKRLARWADSPFSAVGRSRTPGFAEMLLEEVSRATNPDSALQFLAEFMTKVRGVASYQRSLMTSPRQRRRLVGLFGVSPALSRALIGHPDTMDWVLRLQEPPDTEGIKRIHQQWTQTLLNDNAEYEDVIAVLRRLQRELTLHVGLARVSHELDDDDVAPLLTMIADEQIRAAHAFAYRAAEARHGHLISSGDSAPEIAVIGLGTLGGSEMGFGSDLDMIFVYAGSGESATGTSAGEFFTTVARHLVRVLREAHVEGPGFSIDTRLRPNGSHGMLVVSLASFREYYETRAEGWERQALVKARTIFGTDKAGAGLHAIIEPAAYLQGAPSAERTADLRARLEVELGQETHHRWHPKLGYGALVDVEFIVQWLQMTHGADPTVRTLQTKDAIHRLELAGYLSAADARTLEDGWVFFRSILQALRLLGDRVEPHFRPGGPRADQLARWLGVRARDALPATDALEQTWARRAEAVRLLLNRIVHEVGTTPPWARKIT